MNDNKAIIKAEIYIGKGFLILLLFLFAILFAMLFMGGQLLVPTMLPPLVLVSYVYLTCYNIISPKIPPSVLFK